MKPIQQKIKDILALVKKSDITPEEGMELIKKLKENASREGYSSDSNGMNGGMTNAIVIERPGVVQDICMKPVEVKDPEEGEVQILVKAFSLNFGDLLCVKGLYPNMPEYPFVPGFEVSGTVRKVGSGVSRVKEGDEVIGLMGEKMGGQKGIVNTSEKLVVKKPKNLSHEEACAFPIVYITMHHVFERAGIKKGEKVLIQTAAGGTGLIAVQMAKLVGAKIFATAGSDNKIEYLRSLGVKNLINYRNEDFEDRVMKMTDGKGVDVVINTLSGDAIQKGINILAPGGRYMEIAVTGLRASNSIDLSGLVDNQTFHSIDLRRLMARQPLLVQEYLDCMSGVLAEGKVKPTVKSVFSFDDIRLAYKSLEDRENIGKIVVSYPQVAFETVTNVVLKSKIPEAERDFAERYVIGGDNRDIAVIGMAGKFPGADNIDEFWDNLANGRSSIIEVPKERWNADEYFDTDSQKLDKTYSKWGGFIKDIDCFDPLFFNMSGKEADLMDPQQRLFLEESWKALEDAGYSSESLSGSRCAVFAGVGGSDYAMAMYKDGEGKEPQSLWGTETSVLPARIAYFMNLKGPSVAVNTACSSSLVAIHLACQSILNGDSEIAVAGGAFVSTTPNFFIASSNAGMLSPDGKCKTFDDSANGFVAGEGVAVTVLKPLEAALRDKDHIYGVIKGSGINQDGKTNGITAPSTLSQTEIEAAVYKKSGINPETINYVEAHGTGTKLGDPIEIEALTNAFSRFTNRKAFCQIGSVKTNIGHTSAAAGVSSFIKVMLALDNKKIPPSLNYSKTNRHIDFENSPFNVNTTLKEWETEQRLPRRAAISSFGISGTNAHVVVEEAPDINTEAELINAWYLIPFAAKNAEALISKLKEMLEWMDKKGAAHSLADMAYTLSVGRNHYNVRAAFIVKDKNQLYQQIKMYLEKNDPQDMEYFVEKPSVSDNKLSEKLVREIANEEKSRDEALEKLEELAALYLKGCSINFSNLYLKGSFKRISLPTYPFAKEKHWIQKSDNTYPRGLEVGKKLHPLVEKNTSTLEEQKFSTTLCGNEFFLVDHKVGDKMVLPGVAYVEMARAAAQLSGIKNVGCIKDIVWASPIVLDGRNSKEVNISLFPSSEYLGYEVWTEDQDHPRIVHSQGKICFGEQGEIKDEFLDTDSVMRRCPNVWDTDKCYKIFDDSGLYYGKTFRCINEIYSNDDEAFSKFQLPADLKEGISDFVLHPSLMDAAMQTVSAILGETVKAKGNLYLPFSLEKVEINAPLTKKNYAYATEMSASGTVNSNVKRFNILILDETGKVCVKIQDLIFKPIAWSESKNKTAVSTQLQERKALSIGTSYFKKVWKEAGVLGNQQDLVDGEILIFARDKSVIKEMDVDRLNNKLVFVTSGNEYRDCKDGNFEIDYSSQEDYLLLVKALKLRGFKLERILHMLNLGAADAQDNDLYRLLDTGVHSLFYLTKAFTEEKLTEGIKLLFAFDAANGNEPAKLASNKAVGGFVKSLSREYPGIYIKTVFIEGNNVFSENVNILMNELVQDEKEEEVCYKGTTRYTTAFEVLEPEKLINPDIDILPLKAGGIYIITGGAKGLGSIFAKYLAQTANTRLLLVGRSDLDEKIAAKIKELESIGAEAVYLQADLSRFKDVEYVVDTAKSKWGKIDGVIHCAGLTKDSMIMNKSIADFDEVLAPKVMGTVWLDQLTSSEKLDFFVMFSSFASISGNVGQSDYSYANAFMDSYALERETLRKKNKRYGRSITINWPAWSDGGMKLDAAASDFMEKSIGIHRLETDKGIKAFLNALLLKSHQVIVLEGEKDRISAFMEKGMELSTNAKNQSKDSYDLDKSKVRIEVETYLKKALSKETRISLSSIKSKEPMENYGIDSVMIINLTKALEADFGQLSKTLFFEYKTIYELADYLMDNFGSVIMDKIIGGKPQKIEDKKEIRNVGQKEELQLQTLKTGRFAYSQTLLPNIDNNVNEEIAIIGLSGKYPMAENIYDFWDVLKEGKDCITEIPEDRWDYRSYFDSRRGIPGKSYCKWGGFISDVDKFDPAFFNISPREAELIDPQERLFLQSVWSTIEDAGYSKSALRGKNVGVFVGVMYGHYQIYGADRSLMRKGITPGSSFASVANRVSYFMDFHGPSIAMDTMCSSSLTSIHLACNSIRIGESEIAVAGGVNLAVHPYKYNILSQGRFASTDGRCRSFGEGGDGYVPGEGVGSILLKPLSKALADGDHIYGVIKASSINHGGKTNGYSVPNPNAQGDLIADALKKAKINPERVSYIEAHGTGTSLGDPIEITGLKKAFEISTNKKQFCSIGSVKSNIGHLESAAGIAGITKILLQMKNKKLVPSLHSENLNSNIDFQGSPFYVQRELSDWKVPMSSNNGYEKEKTRIAAVSSFGAGGANGHIIIEEFEQNSNDAGPESHEEKLFLLSAREDSNLKNYAKDMLTFLRSQDNSEIDMEKVAYTLQVGREAMESRLAIIASSKDELIEGLEGYISGKQSIQNVFARNTRVDNQGAGVLVEGRAGKEFLKIVIADGEVEKLALLWVSGVEIDWRLIYGDRLPKKISLPTYPFAKERCWIPVPVISNEDLMEHDIDQYEEQDEIFEDDEIGTDSFVDIELDEIDENTLVSLLKTDIQKIAAEILKMDASKVDTTRDFGDFGFESIGLKELSDKIASGYSIEITPALFFAHKNINDLANYLLNDFRDSIVMFYKKSASVLTKRTLQKAVKESVKVSKRSGTSSNENTGSNKVNEKMPIAVIGMSGVFPCSKDLDEFWENLVAQKDLITEVPSDRWDWKEFHSDYSTGPIKTKTKWGGFIPDVDKFDPLFFNISPLEAEMMDPQHRIFMEMVWKAFEDGGYKVSEFSGKKVGLFAGVQFNDYQQLLANEGNMNAQMGTGNEHSILVNRISYMLNFNGPSEPVNTACSSSGVAIHRAVNSIRAGESEIAVAGGISLMLAPVSMIGADQMGILSPDGRCKTLDKSANGYVKGEGVGALLLKPLDKAEKDGDRIYAVIKGTSVNHGGKASSLTAPNPVAQAALLVEAYTEAKIHPQTVSYLELHGTGTELGDPIEIEGIKDAFKQLSYRTNTPIKKHNYCAIGSVKTNIGHLEPASGIAGVIKVLLSMKNRKIPGILHFKELNPYIKLENTPFYTVDKTIDWKRFRDENGNEIPLRAGVSSFGFGGVNSHIVLEEYMGNRNEPVYKDTPQIFVLSAKNNDRLKDYSKNMLDYIKKYYASKDFEPDMNVLDEITSALKEISATVLDVDLNNIEAEEDIVDYGFDAINVVELAKGINEKYGLNLNSESIGEKRNLKLLSKKIYEDVLSLDTGKSASDRDVCNITYTLQVGREEMNSRLSFVVSDIAELIFKLEQFLCGKDGNEGIYRGEIKKKTEKAAADELIPAGMSEAEFAEKLATDKNWDMLAKYWAFGGRVDWDVIHEGQQLCRVSLPTYPFERRRYWALKPITFKTQKQQELMAPANKGLSQEYAPTKRKRLPPEIFPINLKGDKLPMFCVHGAPGFGTFFTNLSKALGKDYPFYAFQAKGIDGKSIPQQFYEMVDHYIECMFAVQKDGPYIIGGYSFGGLVAYEMARRVSAMGKEVGQLILFDTYPKTDNVFDAFYSDYDPKFFSLLLGNEFANSKNNPSALITPEDLDGIEPRFHFAYVAKLAKERGKSPLPVDDIYNYFKGSKEVSDYSEEGYKCFEPLPYDGSKVLFFKAIKGYVADGNSYEWRTTNLLGSYDYPAVWRELIKSQFDVVEVPSDHFNILEEPSINIVKEKIRAIIDDVSHKTDGNKKIQEEIHVSAEAKVSDDFSKVESRSNPGSMVDLLKAIVADRLRMEPKDIDENENLSEYGVDSILSSSIMETIQDRLGRAISLNAIFEYPTLNDLAGYIEEEVMVGE